MGWITGFVAISLQCFERAGSIHVNMHNTFVEVMNSC